MGDHRETAGTLLRAALNGAIDLRAKEAGFLGQMAFEPDPPSERQGRWLSILAERHGISGENRNG